MSEQKERNVKLDVLKFLCSINVVFIHCWFPGNFGNIVAAIGQIAVPIFFLSSGYFWDINKELALRKKNLRRKTKHILILLIEGIIFVIIAYLVFNFSIEFNIKNIVRLLFINDTSFFCGPYWFMFSLIYCYTVICYIEEISFFKKNRCFVIFSLIVFRLLIRHFINEFSYYNNWLFCGIIYFELSLFIKEKNFWKKINGEFLILGLLSIFLLSILFYFGIILVYDLFIIVSASLLFCYCISENSSNSKQLSLLAKFGRKYSTHVYLCHFPIIKILNTISLDGFLFWEWAKPLLAAIVTIIWSVFYVWLKNKVIDFVNKRKDS